MEYVFHSTACKQCEINDKIIKLQLDRMKHFGTHPQLYVTKRTSTHTLKLDQIVTHNEIYTNMTNNSSCSKYPCNNALSSGATESDGMLYLMKRMHTVMKGKIYYECIVSNDDNRAIIYMTRPKTIDPQERRI